MFPPGRFYVGEKVVWHGKRGRVRLGHIESIRWNERRVQFYIVSVLNRLHGGQRAVRLYSSQLSRATIVDEIAALADSKGA
jgi:hypothetical protein